MATVSRAAIAYPGRTPPVAEAPRDREITLSHFAGVEVRVHVVGHPKIGPDAGSDAAPKRRRRDADHRIRSSVDADLAADRPWIPPVPASPRIVGEHDDRVGLQRLVFLRQERSPPLGLHAHHVELVAGDHLAEHHLALGTLADARREQTVLCNGLEDVLGVLLDERRRRCIG